MRVALIGPVYPYRGGIAHYTAMLARSLAARHDTLVISFARQYPDWLYPGKSDRDPSRQPLHTEAEFRLDPFLPWTWWRAARRIADFGADLVVMQWWTTFWAPAFGVLARLVRGQGRPLVFIIHNVVPHEPGALDSLVARLTLAPANAFIAQATAQCDQLRSLLPDSAIRVSPHPEYAGLVGALLPRDEARRRLGIPLADRLLLFFGIVRPYKGLAYLLDALAMLTASSPPVRLLVAGEIWEGKDEYLAQIARLGLGDRVNLDDRYIPDEELAACFSAADLFVAPHVGGSQSGAIRAALGFGLPVVAADAIASDLPAGDAVRVVPSGDAAALARALAATLEPQALALATSAAAAVAAQGQAGWDATVDILEQIAAETAGGERPA